MCIRDRKLVAAQPLAKPPEGRLSQSASDPMRDRPCHAPSHFRFGEELRARMRSAMPSTAT
eukprot:11802190-Alexandrium_andersonii.AAC.1